MGAADTTTVLAALTASDWLFLLFIVTACALAFKPNKFR